MADTDLIENSLEIAAEKAGDISKQVYEHYFAACPESKELMKHMDHLMRARMLDEVIMLMMMPVDETEQAVIKFEISTHTPSGVQTRMYLDLFNAVHRAVSEAVGSDWSPEHDDAWKQRIDHLWQQFSKHSS